MGQCRPVGSGARRSSSVLHQHRRHIFRIENVFPCPQDGLQRKNKTPGQPQWRPNTAPSEGLYLRSSSWLHDNEARSKGRCCEVGPWGGEAGGGNEKDGVAEDLLRDTRTQLGSIAYVPLCRLSKPRHTRDAPRLPVFPSVCGQFLCVSAWTRTRLGQISVDCVRTVSLHPYPVRMLKWGNTSLGC